MKTADAVRELPVGGCYILSAPRIECMMTGVWDARISHDGRLRRVYEDQSEEFGVASADILDTDMDDHSLFRWVECVQSQRAALAGEAE